jgi:hypothetical protein
MEKKIEANYKNLERVNNWITNCDSKAGMVIAFNGILLTYLITKTPLIKKIVLDRSADIPSLLLYIIFCAYAVVLGISVYNAFKVINPDFKEKIPSLFFFCSIAQMDLKNYKHQMSGLTEERIEEELINQSYVNSKIAANKFIKLRSSVNYLLISLIFWSFTLVLIFSLS